jgi:hypothetical protein
LKAECNFGSIGTVSITEHFTGEAENSGHPVIPPDATSRYLKFSVKSLKYLCPLGQYTLSIHKNGNPSSKCKKVGPLLAGEDGFITETLQMTPQGELVWPFTSENPVPLSLLPT